jgi:hypothetical protein
MSNAYEEVKANNSQNFAPTYDSDGDPNQLKGAESVTGEIKHREVGKSRDLQESPYGDDEEPGRCPDSGVVGDPGDA